MLSRVVVLAVAAGWATSALAQSAITLSDGRALAGPVTASSGGALTVTGVAGQPAVGTGTGGGLTVSSGLWLGPVDVVFRLHLAAQWNLVSIPVVPWDARLSTLLAGIEGGPVPGCFWGWNGRNYVTVDRLEPGKAYWVFSSTVATIPVRGRQPDSATVNLPAGWHLLGPLTPPPFAELPLPLVTQPTPGALAPTIWSWNPDADVYAVAGTMECGRGYWVYVFPHTGAEVHLGP